jgi:dCMP deaminase
MNWHKYFFNLIYPIRSKSKDPNTKVGCVIVGPDNEIRSTGYNSFVRGIKDDVPERLIRPEKYFWMEHAERNAIYNAARVGVPLKGCVIYMFGIPCMDCARAIIQAGIKEIRADYQEHQKWKSPRYDEAEMNRSMTLLLEAGVDLVWLYPEDINGK